MIRAGCPIRSVAWDWKFRRKRAWDPGEARRRRRWVSWLSEHVREKIYSWPCRSLQVRKLVKMLPSEIKDPHTFENNMTGSKPTAFERTGLLMSVGNRMSTEAESLSLDGLLLKLQLICSRNRLAHRWQRKGWWKKYTASKTDCPWKRIHKLASTQASLLPL